MGKWGHQVRCSGAGALEVGKRLWWHFSESSEKALVIVSSITSGLIVKKPPVSNLQLQTWNVWTAPFYWSIDASQGRKPPAGGAGWLVTYSEQLCSCTQAKTLQKVFSLNNRITVWMQEFSFCTFKRPFIIRKNKFLMDHLQVLLILDSAHLVHFCLIKIL